MPVDLEALVEAANPQIYAVCAPATTRHVAWMEVFGTDVLPVTGQFPHPRIGRAGLELFYLVDVSRLDDGQIRRAAAHIAAEIDSTPEQIEADIRGKHGLPIPAEGLAISADVEQARAAHNLLDQHRRN